MNTQNQTSHIVELKNVSFARGKQVIYDQVNMTFARGKVTAILGPSGTGKTTLLRLIGGQLRAQAGEVLVDDQNVAKLSRRELLNLRKKMGFLFQSGALLTDLSVFENVAFPLREHTRHKNPQITEMVLEKLESVGLREAATLMPSDLSGGMARRVALARAIALNPSLTLYDEPFTGQDPLSMAVLMRLIRDVNDKLGLSSIVVSHDVAEVLSISDHVYVVAEGQVKAAGSPAQIRANTDPWVQQFIQGKSDGPVRFHYVRK